MGKYVYKLNDETFNSKSAVITKYKKIVNDHLFSLHTKIDAPDSLFLMDLFKMHPQYEMKKGCGIDHFEVWPNKEYPNQNCIYIIRTDGSSVDISYKPCLDRECVNKDKKDLFNISCRNLIVKDLNDFKNEFFQNNINPVCELSNKPLTWENSDVDHKKPKTFDFLVKQFIEENKINIEDVEFDNIDAEHSNDDIKFADTKLRSKFLQFHRENAELRVLSIEGNRKIAKQKY